MLPYCALNPKFVYQSAQFDRFSDQFFIVPRAVADSWFMAILEFQRQGWVNCMGGKNGAIKSTRGHTASLYDPHSNKVGAVNFVKKSAVAEKSELCGQYFCISFFPVPAY